MQLSSVKPYKILISNVLLKTLVILASTFLVIYIFNLKTFFDSEITLTTLAYLFSFCAVMHYIFIKNSHPILKQIYTLISDEVFYLSCFFIIFDSLNTYIAFTDVSLSNDFLGLLNALILASGFILLQNKYNKAVVSSIFNEPISFASNDFWAPFSKKFIDLKFSYILAVITIFIIGLTLRVWNLDYIQGSDLFNLSSAKALFDNGTFHYERNLQITYLTSYMFKMFDATLFYARLPLAIFGSISIILIFILGNFISKKVGLISCILLALSPVAIEESTLIREYSENLLIALVGYIFIFYISKNFINLKLYILKVLSFCSVIFIYSKLVNNYTLQLVILIIAFSAIPGLFINLKRNKHYPEHLVKKFIYTISAILVLFFLTMHLFFAGFYFFGYETFWFFSFFSPSTPYPMQWFSFTSISIALLVALFILPIIFTRNKFIAASFFSFSLILLLFTFKFENTLSYVPTRYLYVIFPFYILVFSSSIFIVTKLLADTLTKKIIISLLFISIFINPTAILNATHHDLVRGWPTSDLRQPTSTGTRQDVSELLSKLTEMKVLPTEKPIVLTDFNPSWLVLQKGSTIAPQRYFSDNGNYKYDIGSNIYLENDYWNIYELEEQVHASSSGVYITRSSKNFSDSAKFGLTNFNLVLDYKGFEVYTW